MAIIATTAIMTIIAIFTMIIMAIAITTVKIITSIITANINYNSNIG